MKSLKNTTTRNAKMLKMDDNIYQLRRKVMDVLYEIKNRGYNIPRVEVRVVSEDTEACAYAYLGKNIIHFNKKYMNVSNFTQVVLHEVVHASFGVGEVVGCRLMHCTEFWKNNVGNTEAWSLFDKYYREQKFN
jgi:predicted SprT family Zn-dependent metalloprotease